MNKTVVEVPAGIRYISEWSNFDLPEYPHIIDKKIPGCGFTEWVLTNNSDCVLACPRRMLLENKYDQHSKDVYYVINDLEEPIGVDKNLTSYKKLGETDEAKIVDDPIDNTVWLNYFDQLSSKITDYINVRHENGLPAKILVTYDSFYLVHNILLNMNNLISKFQVVVDEFQSVFVDSKFKSTTEMKFLTFLKMCDRVCFVSATPMMENYLDQLDEFKDLPYFEFDWNALQPGRIIKPDLDVKLSKSIKSTAKKIIDSYRSGKFEYATSSIDGSMVLSKEAVIYVNSVRNIYSIVKNCNLLPEEVNILCAKTKDNEKKLVNKLGNKYSIGRVPLLGEPHKRFTLCTRTVYLGADFYSDNARTFVISDANISSLAVDISLDLPQILGRQRLDSNPWKNKAIFYYKPLSDGKIITKEDFDRVIEKKLKLTTGTLNLQNNCSGNDLEAYIDMVDGSISAYNYRRNYVALNNVYDPITGKIIGKRAVWNKLVIIAEQRAYDIQQIDYKDRFAIFNNVSSISNNNNNKYIGESNAFFNTYKNIKSYYDKLKYLCTYQFSCNATLDMVLDNIGEKHFKEYYKILGPDKCKSLGYDITKIGREINVLSFNQDALRNAIYANFSEGNRYTRTYIKDTLSRIYYDIGYKKQAKAIDVENWFVIKSCLMNEGNKRVNAFKLIQRKQC